MNEKIYIVGHKNPDTDSICAALAYADLKQRLGVNAVACRLGPLNEETKFVMNKFNLDNPLLLKDARSQLMDIETDKASLIKEDASLNEAWNELFVLKNKSLCVVDDNNNLTGIVSVTNLVMPRLMLQSDVDDLMRCATLDSIAKTIGGKVVLRTEDFQTNGKIFIVTLSDDKLNLEFEDSICILSDGDTKQHELIKAKAKLLVITCDTWVSDEIMNEAKQAGCAIIKTVNDTMHVSKMITESYPIRQLMTKNPITFRNTEYVDDVSKRLIHTRYRSYPLLDEQNCVVGAISRYHLSNYARKKFILVDHSSKEQAINYIMDAEIEEIIDHHNIGNIVTSRPIYYRNERRGSTCTIIAEMYEENNIIPSKEMAGIMASAIISDTLNFKSQTTTSIDIEIANKLAKIAEIDLESYALDMLSASVALKDSTPSQILNRDLKTYQIGKYKIAIGQTNYRNMEDIQSILPSFKENLKAERRNKDYDLMIMMFTHVMAEGSMFVYSGDLSYLMQDIVKTSFDDRSGFDPDIISRKQQLVPKISVVLQNL